VISLSLVTYTDADKMIKAIQRARSKDIVVLISTADEGLMTTTTRTDKHDLSNDVITIAACDRWGNLLAPSQKDGYQYRFVGHNVRVGQIPFLKSEKSISGSSVATATAAGTASLILACCRISSNCDTSGTDWRVRMVRKQFWDKMGEGDERLWKYVALENLCGKGKKLSDIEFEPTVSSVFVS
jgi:hypothetical protein